MKAVQFDPKRRIASALRYMDKYLDRELSLKEVANAVYLSPYYFHRQFRQATGYTLAEYLRVKRLDRAAHVLYFRQWQAITDIAMALGYSSPELFSRSFRRRYRMSPSGFRRATLASEFPLIHKNIALRKMEQTFMNDSTLKNSEILKHVEIVEFSGVKLATVKHRGAPQGIGESIQRLIAWRREHRLPPAVSRTFNRLYPPCAEFEMDLCAEIKHPVADNQHGVYESEIPACRCARLSLFGSDSKLEAYVRILLEDWLPESGYQLCEQPIFLQRVSMFPDVPESEMQTDIYMPIC